MDSHDLVAAMTWPLLIAVIGAILGTGGVAAFIRAYGQNRTDMRSALASEQATFRQDLAAQIARLETRVDSLEQERDKLAIQNASQIAQIATLETQNTQQSESLKVQRTLIDESGKKITALETRQTDLVEENAKLKNQLQVAEITISLLKRGESVAAPP